ncbi:MAG TPA: D-alanyl-D-alanine carboxypeptidase [Halomicronema sp.]
MLKTDRFIFVLSLALFGLVNGCSPTPKTTLSPNSEGPKISENKAESLINDENYAPKNQIKPVVALSPENPQSETNKKVENYVNKLSEQGFLKTGQGVWIEANDVLLANHQGTLALPAASVTKAATSLAVLQTYGPDKQFITEIGTTGPIENGVLQGDLVIQGGEDPFFVWEEAMAIGNILNEKGIKQVKGNLVIVGKFYMNFETKPETSGNFLKEALNNKNWPAEAEDQYQTLPPGTPKPEVVINGTVQVVATPPSSVKPLIRHYSFPVAELLKKMNMYSNNLMAEMLADAVGGAKAVSQKTAEAAGVPTAEIQLINGSGLGEENRISPRAAVGIFKAIEQYLKPYNMTIADIFSITGKDVGVLESRPLPAQMVIKTGTLNRVSSLAGAMPTKELETVWVAIMNTGENQEGFRNEQEIFLKSLLTNWGAVSTSPAELTPNAERKNKTSSNEVLN